MVDTKWIVWLNFVRDAYGVHHKITPRDANWNMEYILKKFPHQEHMLRGLFNSATSHEEAARQVLPPHPFTKKGFGDWLYGLVGAYATLHHLSTSDAFFAISESKYLDQMDRLFESGVALDVAAAQMPEPKE